MKLTIEDGRDSFYTFDTNRILLLTATDEEQINQVEFSTEENGETVSWTSDVLTGEDGIKYVQVPNEFLNGNYSRLVCYYVALDSKGEYTRQKEVFRIRARQEPEDYFLTYSERVTFASIKALTEQYMNNTKQYMDSTEGFKNNASDSADLARKYAENNEDVAVELGKYSAKHWSIKAEAAKETAVQKATEAGTSEVNSKTYMESAQSAKQDAETAKNAANTILEQVQSNGTEITNFVATSKTEIETQKNESVNAVKSVYQTDLNELKGDLDNKDKFLKDNITEDVISLEYTEIIANVTNDGSITNSSNYRCRYIQVYKGFIYVINAEEVSEEKSIRIAFFDEEPKDGLTGEFIKVIGGSIKDYTYIPSRDGYIACGTWSTNNRETFLCKTVLSIVNERINVVEKSITEINLNAFVEIKDRLSFGIGQINNGQFISNFPYRISSNKNERFDYTISVKMDDGFSCGFVTFDSIEQETSDVWSGWVTECIIPANTIFKIQTKCDTDIAAITDVRDNVIYKAMNIRALSDSDLMVKEFTEDATFDFSNPLKIVRVASYKWTQGACVVGNKYVGFDASNDDHTNTGYANIGMFDDFSTSDRITHNLGHCASADYDEFTDTMLVANGTDASGVSPSVFLIKNAKNIVENKTNIVYGSDGVVEIPFDGIDGEGIVACFGETSNIIYVVSTESASLYYQKGEKYIYRVVLGMGNYNMNTLFDSNNFGTYIENCSDNEFNGTAHILEKYTTNWLGELQGLKYINGKLIVSTDLRLNGVGTGFLTVVKLSNGKAKIEKNKWIPCVNEKAEIVNDVETEGVLFNGSDGYVTAISKFSTGNIVAVYRFNLCEL